MKRGIAVIMTGILMISFSACGRIGKYDAHKEIYKRYSDMKSYYAEVEITAKNERSENVYHMRQFYKAPDMYSTVADSPESVAGSGYVFKNGEVTVKSGFGKKEIIGAYSPNERSFYCLADFFDEYYKSEETSVTVSGGGLGSSLTQLECQLGGKNINLFRQSLWIDNETFLPVKLESYDVNNNVVSTVVYNEFKLNCEMEASFFE